MSLSIEPKKGVRLKLTNYSVIKTWQGGGKFWEHDFQLTIRQGTLQEFLPRATEDGDTVFFEHFVDGNEAASASTQVSTLDQVPGAQIERLRAALAELKAKADDPHCDNNKKRMIEAFRLPDPQKDAELYRLYGSGSSRRLIVLWGVEKEVGSALAPLKALERVPQKEGGGGGKTWLWLLILLLLLIGAWVLFHKFRETTSDSRIADWSNLSDVSLLQPLNPTDPSKPPTDPSKPPTDPSKPPIGMAYLEIISTRSSDTPKDGRVEVLLNVLAHDGAGVVGEAPTITQWSVDGKVQRTKEGKPLTSVALPTQLAKGTHRVTVIGVGRDGKQMRAEAEIEVGVKVKEESSVKVRPMAR